MNNTEIKYVSFMRSYWEAAKTIKDWEERLAFYEAIFEYGFEGQDKDYSDIPQLQGLLTLVKPTIDSNKKIAKRNRENGAKNTGISGGLTQEEAMDEPKKNTGLLREREWELERDIEREREKETNDTTLLPSIHQYLIDTGFISYSLQMENEINKTLTEHNLDIGYLKYVYDVLVQKYPNNTKRQHAQMFNKAFKWDNLLTTYTPQKKEPVKEKETNPPPKKCPICNSKLIRNGLDQVICGHCREQGKIVWWEKENGTWQRQDSETV